MGLLSNLFEPEDHFWCGHTYELQKVAVAPDKRNDEVKALVSRRYPTRCGAFVHINAAKEPWAGLSSANCILRTLLFEIDNASLTMEEQLEIFQKSGLPFSAAVSSGNKSLHVTVSLTEPLKSLTEYKELHARIRCLVGHPDLDKGNDKPILSTKIPTGRRVLDDDTIGYQKCYYMGSRVALKELETVLTTPKALAKWAADPASQKPKKQPRRAPTGRSAKITKILGAWLVNQGHELPEDGDRFYLTCPCCNSRDKFCVGRRDDGNISFSCFKGCSYDDIKQSLQGEEQ